MRVSHDKLNKLAHVIADTLAETDECEFHEDRNTIRQESRKMLEKLFAEELKIDQAARLKVSVPYEEYLLSRQFVEREILYRKYYQEEVKKPPGCKCWSTSSHACCRGIQSRMTTESARMRFERIQSLWPILNSGSASSTCQLIPL